MQRKMKRVHCVLSECWTDQSVFQKISCSSLFPFSFNDLCFSSLMKVNQQRWIECKTFSLQGIDYLQDHGSVIFRMNILTKLWSRKKKKPSIKLEESLKISIKCEILRSSIALLSGWSVILITFQGEDFIKVLFNQSLNQRDENEDSLINVPDDWPSPW